MRSGVNNLFAVAVRFVFGFFVSSMTVGIVRPMIQSEIPYAK